MRVQTKIIEPGDVLVSSSLKAVERSAEMLSEVKRNLGDKREE